MKKKILSILSAFFLVLVGSIASIGQTSCLVDDFNSGYGNWPDQVSTYQNTTAGVTGNGTGFNGTNDRITTTSTVTNPQRVEFWLARSSSTANKTFSVQYSADGTTWNVAQDILVGSVTTSHQFFSVLLNLTGTYYLRLVMSQRTGGSYYLDDVEVFCGALTPSNCSGLMSGTYTINAGAAASCTNYQDFASAISDMVNGTRSDDNDYRHDGGIDGAVVFDVTTGTYTEQVSMAEVTGASGTNTITFKSASGTNTDVTLDFPGGAGSGDPNYVFQFNGADYVHIEDMTLERTGSSTYSRVIDFSGDPSNNTIDNCILTGVTTIQTSDYPAVIMNQSSGVQTNNVISNCTIENGSYGMHVECDNGTKWTGFEVTDCEFTNQRYRGIYFEDMAALIITGNSFTTNSVYTSYQGSYMLDCDGNHDISANSLVASNGTGRMQYGIYLSTSEGSHTISGNYIYTTGSGTIQYGIYLTSSGATGSNGTIYNNSIQAINGTGTCYPLYLSSSEKLDVLNNTLYVSGGTGSSTYALYCNGTTDGASLKNNVFVNASTGTGSSNNQIITFSSSTVFSGGVSDNAYFTSNTGTPFRGYYAGTYTDFATYVAAIGETGTPQNVDPLMTFVGGTGWKATETSLTNGAPQLSGIALDIDGTSRYNPTTIGAHENGTGTTPPVAAFSANATSTCTATTVTFTDASINTPTSWAWVFSPATVTYVSATSATSQNPQVQFNAPGLYTVTLTATNADGSDDEVKSDYIAVGLSGTYTVGGTTPDYADFTTAVTELNAVGVCGPVVFDVRTAGSPYTEQVSINQFTGSSATNTVTFQSESGTNTDVTLRFASSNTFSDPNYVLQLNGCDYVTFQNMTIERTGTNTYSHTVDISGDASYNTLEGNILLGRVSSPSSGNSEVVFSDDANTGNTNNTVSNNSITGGYAGVHWEGTSSLMEADLTITGNTFSCYRYGMYLRYIDDVAITDNTITNPSTFNSAATQGIYAFHLDGMLTLTGNNIALKSGTNVTGIDLLSCEGTSGSVGLVSNNMISVGSSSSESSAGAGDGTGTTEGIYMNGTTYKNFYYNSFLSTSTNPTTGRAFYLNGPSGAAITLRNNIFAQNGGGYTLYNSITSAISSSDFNDFYATGGTLFAYWGGAQADLLALQTASSEDANSADVNPVFVSNTDLHVSAGTGIDALATTLSVTTDIDGDARDGSTPDIGADEYNNVLPVVTLDADVNTGTEAAATVITLTITASVAVTGNQTVDLTITGTDITAGDYTLSGTTITILNGQTTGSVTFTVVDDAVAEGGEIATATISNASAGIVISLAADDEDLAIVDNDLCGLETFNNSSNTGSYSTFGWTGDNSVDWTATDARGDQDLGADEAVMLRTGSLTNDASVAGGCGTISFDYARIYTGNSTLKVFINGTQYGGDITVSSTTSANFSTVVNANGAVDIELQNSGNRTLISNLTWGCYAASHTIATGTISGSPFCVGNTVTEAVSVPYTITGTFNGPNIFTAQLSDDTGSFASPTSIGTLTSTSAGTISATIPATITAGTGYRIRVVSDDPAVTGSDNGSDIEIQNFAAPTALSATCGSETSSLSWTNPGCFDEVMVVTSSAAYTSALPTGNGSSYTANLAFGSGTAFDGGNVVYKGIGAASGTITGLSNGTTYNFKIYVRKGTVWVAGSTASCTPQTDLFVSEYLEGSGNNKAIEIYNGTGAPADLSDYELRIYSSGSSSVTTTISLSGTLNDGNVYVIGNVGADPAIITVSDQTTGNLNFNGDDAVVLYNNSTSTFSDIIGNIGCDPGTNWTSGSHSTEDKTLVRKITICQGVDVDPTTSCPFPTLVSEWLLYSVDDFSFLGAHSGCNTTLSITTGVISTTPFALTSCTDTETGTVAFTSSGTFNAGNVYSVQLSDEAGNFGSASTIGTLTSTANSGTINITIPAGMDPGTGYKIRVASSDPDVYGSQSAAFTISTTCVPATLLPGDLAILAFNTNVDGTFGYDELSFVSFIDITPGTILDFTDNAYEKCGTTNGWGISEGWFRLTRTTSTLTAGEIVTVKVVYGNASVIAPDANWNISKPQPIGQGNFDLNADGEQVFLLSGGNVGGPGSTSATSDAGTYNGEILYGFNTKENIWSPVCGNAGAGGTKNSAKPVDFDCFLVWPSSQADKNKYTGPMTAASQRDWLYRINNSANWSGYASNTLYEAGTDFKDFNGVGLGRTIVITAGSFSSGIWTGETDTDWHNCSNWQSLRIPDINTDVTIPITVNNPHILTTKTGQCKTIDIDADSGAKVYIDGTGRLEVTQP